MVRVNYVRECRAFQAAAGERQITANEVVLWHAMFELFNRKAEGDRWPEGFIPFSNAQLLALTPFGSGDSGTEILRRAREKLVKRGLIRYKPGQRRSRMPEYSLVYFCAEPLPAEAPPMTESAPQTNAGHESGAAGGARRVGGKALSHPEGRDRVRPYDLPPNQYADRNHIHTPPDKGGFHPRAAEGSPAPGPSSAARGYDLGWKTSARARGAVAQRLLDRYRGRLDTADPWGDLCELMAGGLPPDVIELALPTRPCFSGLVARLRALTLCRSIVPKPPG